MSCLKSTTYWVSLFLILHVKYGIKRPNSLSFFFIILASGPWQDRRWYIGGLRHSRQPGVGVMRVGR